MSTLSDSEWEELERDIVQAAVPIIALVAFVTFVLGLVSGFVLNELYEIFF